MSKCSNKSLFFVLCVFFLIIGIILFYYIYNNINIKFIQKNKRLYLGLSIFFIILSIFFIILSLTSENDYCIKQQYYKCENQNCIKCDDCTDYLTSNCDNKCKSPPPPPPQQYYKCENQNCIKCDDCTDYLTSNCDNKCKSPPPPPQQYYKCENQNCIKCDDCTDYLTSNCDNKCKSPPPPPQQYYKCENQNCIKCDDCTDYLTSNCDNKCKSPPPSFNDNRRIISYWEGWKLPFNSDSIDDPDSAKYPISYGNPASYTHMVFSFLVPYHFWGGSCSKLCTLWDSTDDILGNYGNSAKMITDIRAENPNIKIMLSFGGWNFSHMNSVWVNSDRITPPKDWNDHIVQPPGCNSVCDYSEDPTSDYPALYQPDTTWAHTKCLANTDKDSSGNYTQPSYYCYGAGAVKLPSDTSSDSPVVSTAKRVAKNIFDIINRVGADGLDMDIEDTDSYKDSNSPVFVFIKTITTELYGKILKNGKQIILSQAPIQSYVITGKTLNPYFSDVAANYVNMLKELKDDKENFMLDYISVQFYNGVPDALDNPSDTITAYNQIVNDIFDGDSSRVVVGMCSFPESTNQLKNAAGHLLAYPPRPTTSDKKCSGTDTSCVNNSDCVNGLCIFPNTGNYTCNNCVGDTGEYLCSDPNFKGVADKTRVELITELSNNNKYFGGVMFWVSPGDDPTFAYPEHANGGPIVGKWSKGRFGDAFRNAMGPYQPKS
jgi:hypothetical protein